ncbi:uncharacterized protein MONBRDRAFT_28899 [Monosiga brevicollis MX1]|uniref:CDT1 Geminin-binding domain-containing protein n=1 Tax=Monosiga brevicollis TaxID=81824 RepID=A9V9D9_MONBE|nr:uncharacterized protein MONBRDRAFT_28899 [Monosiga brevicollis MX1]EDQ85844.1 predicted protein [Monosiga brevicollis MX1]|eukprot:XP_001749323.1 hypothetical protein [Monosiga brevicollis MX1]
MAKRGTPTMHRLKPQVEAASRRRFDMTTLSHLVAYIPDVLHVSRLEPKDRSDPTLRILLTVPEDSTSMDRPSGPADAARGNDQVSDATSESTEQHAGKEASSTPGTTPGTPGDIKRVLAPQQIAHLHHILRARLLDQVFEAHAEHLQSLPGSPAVARDQLQRWARSFALADVPLIKPASLPDLSRSRPMTATEALQRVHTTAHTQPQDTKTSATGQPTKEPEPEPEATATIAGPQNLSPVLSKAATPRHPTTPHSQVASPKQRLATALLSAAGRERTDTAHAGALPASQDGTAANEGPPGGSTLAPTTSGRLLREGLVSSDMLSRIASRQKQRTEAQLTMASLQSQRQHELEKLPVVVNALWGSYRLKSSQPLPNAIEAVSKSCRMARDVAERQIRFAAETLPDWCQILERDGRTFCKINRKQTLGEVKKQIDIRRSTAAQAD